MVAVAVLHENGSGITEAVKHISDGDLFWSKMFFSFAVICVLKGTSGIFARKEKHD